MGSDFRWLPGCSRSVRFQSTLPVWGATGEIANRVAGIDDFNPRSPCGERLNAHEISHRTDGFQSTLPVWGATWVITANRKSLMISIHAPRVGSDTGNGIFLLGNPHFNPRSPCGERRCRMAGTTVKGDFNPRSPCGERQLHAQPRKQV